MRGWEDGDITGAIIPAEDTMQKAHLPEALKASEEEPNTELVPASDPRSGIISIDPERRWGTPCIAGTRVPIKSLFGHLASGISLEEFLDDFEGVPRESCVKAIELAFERLMEGLPSSGNKER